MKQEIKELMDTFVKFINAADEKMAHELVSNKAVFFAPTSPEALKGPEGYMAVLAMMRSGFSDIQWTLEETVIENNKIAARFTMKGRHNGDFMGISATGKSISVQATNFYEFEEGKIIKEYGQPDLLSLLIQIGALPQLR